MEAINDYSGAVILVSHDRHLLEACADRLWLVADGTVTAFDGDLDDYSRLVLADRGGAVKAEGRGSTEQRAGRADIRRAAAERRAELAPLRQRIAAAEKTIARLNAEVARIDTALADPQAFARDPQGGARLAKARADAVAAIARAEEDWLDASTAYEGANV
jgi:ATP-binding cassette subfamily F protein 3